MKKLVPFILVIVLVLFLASKDSEKIKDELVFYDYFDTITTINIFEEKFTDEQIIELEELLQAVHHASNRYDETGLLYELNSNKSIAYNLELSEMLSESVLANELNEEFNIAIAPVASIWEEYRNTCLIESKCLVPTSEELQATLLNLDNQQIVNDGIIAIPNDMKLDLGAVAKGYATDKLVEKLESFGYEDYTINLGGNVMVGKKDVAYVIGITNPLNTTDYLTTIEVENKSVVTSGDYERYYEVGGVRYHHLLDVKTLFPARQMRSITVVHDSSLKADIYSTMLFSLEVDEALAFADKHELSIIIFDLDGNTRYSKKAQVYDK